MTFRKVMLEYSLVRLGLPNYYLDDVSKLDCTETLKGNLTTNCYNKNLSKQFGNVGSPWGNHQRRMQAAQPSAHIPQLGTTSVIKLN